MARKKKQTRKYTPKNEFRQNHSPSARGHYDFVFGETDKYYKSIGLTTHPEDGGNYFTLAVNPNPNDVRCSHIKKKPRSTMKRYMPKVEEGWGFDKNDMPIVRHIIKEYKKSTNRKPKNWYAKNKKMQKKKMNSISILSMQ